MDTDDGAFTPKGELRRPGKEKPQKHPGQDLELRIDKQGGRCTNFPFRVRYRGQQICWGTGGRRSTPTALNALLCFLDYPRAYEFHLSFKWQFIASLPERGDKIPGMKVRRWLNDMLGDSKWIAGPSDRRVHR